MVPSGLRKWRWYPIEQNALCTSLKDEEAVKDERIKKLKPKIGDLVLANDILREALKPYLLDRKALPGYGEKYGEKIDEDRSGNDWTISQS